MLGLTNRKHPLLPAPLSALLPALALAAALSIAPQPAHAGVTSFFVDLWGNLADAVSMSGQAPAAENEAPKAEPATPAATEALLPPIKAAPVKKVETEMPAEPTPAMKAPVEMKVEAKVEAKAEAKVEPIPTESTPTMASAASAASAAPAPEDGPVARGMNRVAGLLGGARREENLHGLPVR